MLSLNVSAQQKQKISKFLQAASYRYGIPVEILAAIAGSQTKFTIPELKAGFEDSHHQPPVYGIMALRDDLWFGHSLREAAVLTGQPVAVVRDNTYYNIMGAAAYLSKLAADLRINRKDLASWKQALEIYSGIPQANIREYFSYEVMSLCKEGIADSGLSIAPSPNIDLSVFRDEVRGVIITENVKSSDYAPAVWDSTPNCTIGSISQLLAVVHTTEGSFSGSLSWLKNPTAQASAHYIIRSSDGYMVQLVRESNKAWHARCWNSYMLGVEHEAYVGQPSYYTDAMYTASAGLFRHFAQKFNIPISRNRIIGHNEWQNSAWKTWMGTNYPSIDVTCNTHTDPGQYWDWDFYMQLVSQDTTSPAVISVRPAGGDTIPRNAIIKITFNQKMKKTETQSAFSISPSVTGALSWADNQRTLVFTPSSNLQPGSVYTVTISKAAKNYLALSPIGVSAYTYTVLPQLAVNSAYPAAGTKSVPLNPELKVSFNSLVKSSSMPGNIYLRDSLGNTVSITAFSHVVSANKSTVSFMPASALKENFKYEVVINSTLQDTAGFAYSTNSVYAFYTGADYYFNGSIFDSLEVLGGWKNPKYSGSTVGTDTNSTFTISTQLKRSGSGSGKLQYRFSGASGGVCRVFNANKPNQGSLKQGRVGFWVYGDMSNNFLEYWFYYNSATNVALRVDTLNWLGWKYVEAPVSRITQAGDKLFHSLVIRQNSSGNAWSTVYFDDGQRTTVTKFNINCAMEGLYVQERGKWRPDTVTVSIRSQTSPYALIENQKTVVDSNGFSSVNFSQLAMGDTVYVALNHRSSVEVWTKIARIISVPVQTYDFFSSSANAYGDNLTVVNGKYCMFSGDVNQDGIVDFSDIVAVDNAVQAGQTGYKAADLNGDNTVDYFDMKICSTNAQRYIKCQKPR